MTPIDLRSDLLSRPTPEMIEAVVRASQDAPGFLLREDPWVRRLERQAAELLGKEDALLCPTCTLANQIAIHLQCRPGDIVLTEEGSHVARSEGGAASALSGVSVRESSGAAEDWDLDQFDTVLPRGPTPAGRQRPTMIVLENTHNRSGGTVLSLRQFQQVRALATAHELAIHLDGARLFHAAVHLEVSLEALAADADSVAISLGKGLCAPFGAVLAGNGAFIGAAEHVRQRFGGGWRPAGVVAAAGVVALQTMIERLIDDHAKARRFAELVETLPGVEVCNRPVPTNIVLLRFAPAFEVSALERSLWDAGLRMLEFDRQVLRAVFYRDISLDHVEEAARILTRVMETTGLDGKELRAHASPDRR